MGAAVSKASEWAFQHASVLALRPPMMNPWNTQDGMLTAQVDDDGIAVIAVHGSAVIRLDEGPAEALGKWLLDTFGSAPALSPEGNPGGGHVPEISAR